MEITEKVKQIKSGKLKAVDNVLNFSKKISTPKTKKLNIFLHLNEEALKQAKEIDKKIKQKKQVGKLAGLCFAVKSNICVQDLTTNCGSKVLENFVAPFNATVINKLKAEDAIILGMVNMDEFACGASGETSAFGPTLNPKNQELIPGGSSSGSAAAVAADLCDFALGSDTGGSIRNPASHCGVVGLKPTYGSVSRYGLIDMSMSFDQISPITNFPEDAQLIFNIIKGQDNFDTTTKNPNQSFNENKTKNKIKTIRTIGLVDVSKFCDKKISDLIKQKTHELAEKNKYKIKSVNLPLDIALETYYIIVYTEFFSATRKFDGRRFGISIDKFGGPEVIRRIIGGQEITQAEYAGKYYRHALKAKNYIKEQFEKLFKQVDIIILPTVPKLPHKINSSLTVEEMYAYDIFTTLANIAGIPAISIPAGEIDSKPVGLQILAPHFQEDLIFNIAKKF
jgi:aspartyl-tRNA(Asn)/glutamyl-tRNA(Gln) amidotransferase subunit A